MTKSSCRPKRWAADWIEEDIAVTAISSLRRRSRGSGKNEGLKDKGSGRSSSRARRNTSVSIIKGVADKS